MRQSCILSLLCILSFFPVAGAVDITIADPANGTIGTSPFSVNWAAGDTIFWSAYSIDGGANISIYNKAVQNYTRYALTEETGALGVTENGSFFWISYYNTVTGTDRGTVYKYWKNMTYTGESFNTSSECKTSSSYYPGGIVQNGTHFWIMCTGNKKVYVHWINGTYTGTNYTLSHFGYELTMNDTYFWVSDLDAVHKYWHNWTYIGEDFDPSFSYNLFPPRHYSQGVYFDGAYFWITDNSENSVIGRIHKFYANGTDSGDDWQLNGSNTWPWGIDGNGTHIWVVDLGVEYLYEYLVVGDPLNTTASLSDGYHNITIYANDTSGVMNSSAVRYFTVDTQPPYYQNQTNPATIREGNGFTVYLDAADAYSSVANVTVDIFGSNHTMNLGGANRYNATVSAPAVVSNTLYYIRYYMNDTNGHANSSGATEYSITVEAVSGAGGEDGGGGQDGGVIETCGEFEVYPARKIIIASVPDTPGSPVRVEIYNGNRTQSFGMSFSPELRPYCSVDEYPVGSLTPGAAGHFTFSCIVPQELVTGNVIINTQADCKWSLPVALLPTDAWTAGLATFLYMLGEGDLNAFLIQILGLPVVVWIAIVIAVLVILFRPS